MNESPEELASLYVLDQLDAPARADFEARLLREPELAALVRELEAGWASGVRALPQTPPPADLLKKIEAKIEAEAPDRRPAAAPAGAQRFPFVAIARWGIAAMIAVSLGVLAVQSLRHSATPPVIIVVGLDADRNTFAELPLHGTAKDADARFIQLASLAANFWGNPDKLPVRAKLAAGDNRGYALYDPGSRQGFIAIERLGTIAAHQRYHLWVVDPSTHDVTDAGVLPSPAANGGLYSFALGETAGAKSARPHFFVTVEDENATAPPDQPRGKVVLGSNRL
jgi:anti-sigma-K factor RskA